MKAQDLARWPYLLHALFISSGDECKLMSEVSSIKLKMNKNITVGKAVIRLAAGPLLRHKEV